ncbi:hypothetical protein [Ensifer sp. LCM 4579]|uniref:hypothetical protein n=1 Tax=Ensifer sp. LCM 4579 TaxID=1848292 RepID=UPI0008DAE392|nr:hypothetical protein [Ensifer sp. LCM 4579]OHV85975.1 hypothetical protein LCM4579_01015 [Ensifer sp. LCM 4579]
MKTVLKVLAACAGVIALYVFLTHFYIDIAAGVFARTYGFPKVHRESVAYLDGGLTRVKTSYAPVTNQAGETMRGLTARYSLVDPFFLSFDFGVDTEDFAFENVAVAGTFTPLADRVFDLTSASIGRILGHKPEVVLTGLRTSKAYGNSVGQRIYEYKATSIDLPELTGELKGFFGTRINRITLNVRRVARLAATGSAEGPETIELEFGLGDWGPVEVSGSGRLDLDGTNLVQGDFLVNARGLTNFAVSKMLKAGWGGVLGGTFAIACFTRSYAGGYASEMYIDSQGFFLKTQPPCDMFKPLPLKKFTRPVTQEAFNSSFGMILY